MLSKLSIRTGFFKNVRYCGVLVVFYPIFKTVARR